MKLTDNFYLDEFTTSQTARRRGIDNSLPTILMPNLHRLVAALQKCRNFLGYPIIISSGYRCPQLNQAIRGSQNSDHTFAAAADWICPAFGSPYEVCLAIEPKMHDFGIQQLIHEYGSWIHTGILPAKHPINRVITIDDQGVRSGVHRERRS